MFFWVELPEALDAMALLPRGRRGRRGLRAGRRLLRQAPRRNTLRLSFVTLSPADIKEAVAGLGRVLQARTTPLRSPPP